MAKRPRSQKRVGRPKLTAQLVEKRRDQFLAGDPAALLDAVDLCARAGLPMPVWLAQAFCDRYANWVQFKAASLDITFGVRRPKGMHIKKRAHREWLRPRVVFAVLTRHRDDAPIDTGTFEAVGKEFNTSGGSVRTIYYERSSAGLKKLWAAIEKSRRD